MAVKLPVIKVIVGSVLIPWHYRENFVKALTIPLCSIVAFSVTWQYCAEYVSEPASWALYIVSCVLFVSFAATCHRLVLLGPTANERNLRPEWTRREALFLFWTIALAAIVSVIQNIAGAFILNIPALWHEQMSDSSSQWVMFFARIPALYVFGRLCLVFPATAINRMPNLSWSWSTTKRNGWRLFLIVAVIPCALSYTISLLYRDSATSFEVVSLTVLGALILVVEIAAVSLSYREFVADEPLTET